VANCITADEEDYGVDTNEEDEDEDNDTDDE